MGSFLGIDCGSVSLNLVLLSDASEEPVCLYRRVSGGSLQTFVDALHELMGQCGRDVPVRCALVTGSARELFSKSLDIGALNEITAHATGAFRVSPQVKTIIEVGGQDSKFIKLESQPGSFAPRIAFFRMNEVCAAGTGAFLDEQADRLGISVESFGSLALRSERPVPIAGRCAVFAKTDMIHQAQEGTPIPDILMGLAFALVRNFIATLVRGESLDPPVSLQGGVMNNQAVVKAFQALLGLPPESIIIPPYFEVLGAMGCAVLAQREEPAEALSLQKLLDLAERALANPPQRSFAPPLDASQRHQVPVDHDEITNRNYDGTVLQRPLPPLASASTETSLQGPLILGLDVGSVSVKGVVVDGAGRVVTKDYRLSHSLPLETAHEVVSALTEGGLVPDAVAVTGSGRYLVGRLLQADVIVNEIVAQAQAALSLDPQVETVVEIGGQDSKWIRLDRGRIVDFEMNRVCAAGTGSFLMAQANRLGIEMGEAFSDAALASATPADLGSRCTVFMESDLIHHRNSGASVSDLAAGVCISIVQNYLDRVANHKPIGERAMFLGGVAATDAVRVAMEQRTGKRFHTPPFYQVSGALGAALKGLEALKGRAVCRPERPQARSDTQPSQGWGDIAGGNFDWRGVGCGTASVSTGSRAVLNPADRLQPQRIVREQFQCRGCANECLVNKYTYDRHSIFNGGLCDRWEIDKASQSGPSVDDLLGLRTRLIEQEGQSVTVHREENEASESRWGRLHQTHPDLGVSWGVVRSPQFYEWFPFWEAYCAQLGINLVKASASNRKQFETGARFLRVETCLPMKVLAGQVEQLVRQGVKELFHPVLLTEEGSGPGEKTLAHCAYVQATAQLFHGIWDLEWKGPVVSLQLDSDSFRRDYIRFARGLGFSPDQAQAAIEKGFARLDLFRRNLQGEAQRFLDSLRYNEKTLVILGKPYHTGDGFLNMNLAGLLRRFGIRAIPSDLYPILHDEAARQVPWKYQNDMTRVAHAIADEPNLFPVFITFFGCGPDPFTIRHIEEALKGKPLLVLEMDEHTSRAGITTRLEAFLDRVHKTSLRPRSLKLVAAAEESGAIRDEPTRPTVRSFLEMASVRGPQTWDRLSEALGFTQSTSRAPKPQVLYLPYVGDLSCSMAAAARSFDIDARILPPPDVKSERLGRPHTMGGECHPYVLVLGDYLKLATSLSAKDAAISQFYMPSVDACRLGQWPIYMEKVRRQLGLPTEVILDVGQGLASFGLSQRNRLSLLLKTWEGVNAYDLFSRVFYEIRACAADRQALGQIHQLCCDRLFDALSCGHLHEGMEEVFHILYSVPRDEDRPKPQVVVTGDYYTRIVPFANNHVFTEVEALGGVLRPPPSFSDCFKMAVLRDSVWNAMNYNGLAAARHGMLYMLMAVSELRLKGSAAARRAVDSPLDISGLERWRIVAGHAETRLPAGITAPISTVLQEVKNSADGILNLMTLNCSFGTVVTAALSRVLKQQQKTPMLTLIYDGLKKTNEGTRLEAFMEQVRDHFKRRMDRGLKKCAY